MSRRDDPDSAAEPPVSDTPAWMPAWMASMLVHVIVLLALALIVDRRPHRQVRWTIVSPAIHEPATPDDAGADLPGQADLWGPPAAIEIVASPDVSTADLAGRPTFDDLEAALPPVAEVTAGPETAVLGDPLAAAAAGGHFGGRAQPGRLAAARGGGIDTEAAVDGGLRWLAAHQLADGGWSFDLTACPACRGACSHSGASLAEDRCAATALALLPFLGRGYTHRTGAYQRHVEGGMAFLATLAARGEGRVFGGRGTMYSQGLAGIALAECYGMTRDPRLAAPAQAALDFIMRAQDPVGGGWRYAPGEPGDTSALGWQIMALKSGDMAGLQIAPTTIAKAAAFLDTVQADASGATYGYTDASEPTAGRSAVGILCRMYMGWGRDRPGLGEGVAHLAALGPTDDLYYDYYATQIMHHVGGEPWVGWNTAMKRLLLESQSRSGHEAGSWREGVAGGIGGVKAGRLYCTSLATMILEVYYRHLPIYRPESVADDFRE